MTSLKSIKIHLHLFKTYLTPIANLLYHFVHLQELHTNHLICSTMYAPHLKIPNNHLKIYSILYLFPSLILISLHPNIIIHCLYHHTLSLELMLRLVNLIVRTKLCKLNLSLFRRQVLEK